VEEQVSKLYVVFENITLSITTQKSTRTPTLEHRYEGLATRDFNTDQWRPDYGPSKFVPTWGATASGARKFLVAYNINLLGTKQQAIRIALNLREQGRGPGKEGKLEKVKGIGWYVMFEREARELQSYYFHML
jgi:glutamate formiminotransferase/formiminotetrahydrofolate cyclodeaminase